jgi:EAL domain-containing protein (putative c-di-GMP-specific phosphodiesterase class I)/ActR/RegA family two-component response regulator
MKSQVILVVDDDPVTTEALASSLERENRTVITCNDIDSAKMIVERIPLTLILSDVKFSGPFGFEGLDFLPHVARIASQTPVALMTGASSAALVEEATRRGAIAVLEKPFGAEAVETLLRGRDGEVTLPDATPAVVRIPSLEEILRTDALMPRFQPIVSLQGATTEIHGYESLVRLVADAVLFDAQTLFMYAERKAAVAQLEFACIAGAFRMGAPLTENGKLFVNLHPLVMLKKDELVSTVSALAQQYSVPLERVVFELTEQGALPQHDIAVDTCLSLKKLGAEFAFDDLGVAYSHLALIDRIKPRYLKISQHFGTGCENDLTKLKIVRNILALAADFDSSVILEGIEQQQTADFARSIGVPLGQGFLFGRPQDAQALRKASHQ